MASVQLFSVAWTAGGIDFPSISPADIRTELIDGELNIGPLYTVSFIKGGFFELPVNVENTRYANYTIFTNNNVEYWCAFITSMEWTSNNSTRFYYNIDWVSTFAHNATCVGMRTRQRITTTATIKPIGDFQGTGEVVLSKRGYQYTGWDNNGYVVYFDADTISLGGFLSVGNSMTGGGLQTIVLTTSADIQAFRELIKDEKLFNSIASVYSIPAPLLPGTYHGFYDIDGYQYKTLDTIANASPLTFTLTPNISAVRNLFLNDNDLHIEVFAGSDSIQVKYSDISSLTFDVSVCYQPNPMLTITPRWNNNETASGNLKRSVTFSGFAQLAITVDAFQSWLNNQFINMIASNAAPLAVSGMTNPATFGVQLANTAFDVFNSFRTYHPAPTPQNSNASMSLGDMFAGVIVRTWANYNTDGVIYYEKFGHPVYNWSTYPLTVTGKNYDVYQIPDAVVMDVPYQAQQEIKRLLQNRVRFWSTALIT